MGFWDDVKNVGRIGACIATGGMSEAAIAGYNYVTKGGGLGDKVFGGVKQAEPGDSSNYDYGGSPEYAAQLRQYLQERANAAGGRQAYQLDRSSVDQAMGRFGQSMAGFNNAMMGQQGAFRNEGEAHEQQAQALGMYRDAAMGNAPSVAAAQMRQGLEESSRLGQNLAAGTIGGNPLLASANASAASADASRRSTSAAAQLRAQEIDAARSGYAGLSGQMRQGDLARGDAYLARGNAMLGAHDREGRERLFRYGARPPFALERFVELGDGRIAYRLKTPNRRGDTHRVMTPVECLARLCALVPPPWQPLVRFHGVFAPNHAWRSLVVPAPVAAPERPARCLRPPQRSLFPRPPSALRASDDPLPWPPAPHHPSPPSSPRAPRETNASRLDWATLLARTFALDALERPRCFGRLRPIAVVTAPVSVAALLATARRAPTAQARPPPAVQLRLPLG